MANRQVNSNHYLPLQNEDNDVDAEEMALMQELGVGVGMPKPKKTLTHRRGTRRMTAEEKEKMKHFEVGKAMLALNCTN